MMADVMATLLIISALGAIVLPRYWRAQDNAHLTALKVDLHNLVAVEEAYYSDYRMYTAVLPGDRFKPSPGVTYVIEHADATGWHATARNRFLAHKRTSVTSCHIGVGTDVAEGDIEADPTCP